MTNGMNEVSPTTTLDLYIASNNTLILKQMGISRTHLNINALFHILISIITIASFSGFKWIHYEYNEKERDVYMLYFFEEEEWKSLIQIENSCPNATKFFTETNICFEQKNLILAALVVTYSSFGAFLRLIVRNPLCFSCVYPCLFSGFNLET